MSPAPPGPHGAAGRGSVTFTDNGVAIAHCVDRPISGAGKASCKEEPRPGGDHAVSAVYSGSATLSSASDTVNETFDQKPTFANPRTAFVAVNTPLSFTVTAVGFPAPGPLTETQPVPSWLTVTFGANGTATLTGTPPTVGAVNLDFSSTSTSGTKTQALTITVHS